MKRRIIRASELTDNNKGRADRVAEAYDLLKDLEYKLADLSDEFWTLTPTDSWKRINNVLGYITRARNQIEKVDVSEDVEESCKVNAAMAGKKNWMNICRAKGISFKELQDEYKTETGKDIRNPSTGATSQDFVKWVLDNYGDDEVRADTVKKKSGKWVNRGDTGKEHGEFDTKKEADAQRRAMYAAGYKG